MYTTYHLCNTLIKSLILVPKVGSRNRKFCFFKKLDLNLNKPIILSLGMHNYDDLKQLKNFIKQKFKKLILLNCTTIYPSK